MADGVRERLLGALRAAGEPRDGGEKLPGLRQHALVPGAFEDVHRRARLDLDDLRLGRAGDDLEPMADDAGRRAENRVSRVRGRIERLDRRPSPVEVPGLAPRLDEIGQQPAPSRIPVLEQRRRPAEEARRSRGIAAPVGAPAGRGEPVRRPPRELARRAGFDAELAPERVRLLEVVPDELVDRLGTDALEPVGEPLVQVRPRPLGNRLVGGLADQQVREAEALLARGAVLGPNEVAVDERLEPGLDRGALLVGRELDHCSRREAPADDGRTLEDRALGGVEPIEARGEEGVDRRRHHRLLALALLLEERQHLLEEERVPLRGRRDARADLGRERTGEERVDQLLRFALGQRLQQDRAEARPAARPERPALEQLRPGEAEKQDRSASEVGDVLHELEEGRLCPVHVLEHQDERPVRGERLEHAPGRTEGLLARRCTLARADGAGDARSDGRAFGIAREELRDPGLDVGAERLEQDLAQRPERDPLAVREAPAGDDRGGVAEGGRELEGELRLADARNAEHRKELRRVGVDGAGERVGEEAELRRAADERRAEAPCDRGRVLHEVDQ